MEKLFLWELLCVLNSPLGRRSSCPVTQEEEANPPEWGRGERRGGDNTPLHQDMVTLHVDAIKDFSSGSLPLQRKHPPRGTLLTWHPSVLGGGASWPHFSDGAPKLREIESVTLKITHQSLVEPRLEFSLFGSIVHAPFVTLPRRLQVSKTGSPRCPGVHSSGICKISKPPRPPPAVI